MGANLHSDVGDYEIGAATPQVDRNSTLQLRTSVSQAISSLGKPAPILAMFSVPHGIGHGSHFKHLPPLPVNVPCQIPTPISQLSIRLTNVYGEVHG